MNGSVEEFPDLSPNRLKLLQLLLQEAGEDFEEPGRIEPRTHTGPIPLSFSQQRLWLLHQMHPASPAYNIPVALRLSGPLDVMVLEHSLSTIVERHTILRTTFALVDGHPAQVIMPAEPVRLLLIDLQDWPGDEREVEAHRLVRHTSQQLFDLTRGPLFRVGLLRLAVDDHVIMLTMHHIISDAWSGNLFLAELTALYNDALAGLPARLPELPIQYADFACWQRDWLRSELLADHLAYWRAHLADLPTLEVPHDHQRTPITSFQGAAHAFSLSATMAAELAALSRRQGVTHFMTLLAAFQALLARYSDQDEIVVGTTIANRTRSETAKLIGCFVNTLVLRADLHGDPPFQELLGRVREVCLAAYAHQDLPFEHLVAALHPLRDLSRQPLFQVLFELQNMPATDLKLRDLVACPFEIERTTEKFDLTLTISEAQAEVTAVLSYSTDLFSAPTITRMAGHFQTLLEGCLTDPSRRLSALPLLSKAQLHELLVARNDTSATYPAQRCYHQLVAEQVARTPDAIAVVFDQRPGDRLQETGKDTEDSSRSSFIVHLSYHVLNARAERLAGYLQTLGVRAGVRVGLCLERAPELLIGLLGIGKAGGAFLPLDPAYPHERLAFMLNDAEAAVVLTQARLRARLPPIVPALCLDTDWPRWASTRPPVMTEPQMADHLAYVIYTSGSTGTPKGVLISHRNLSNYLCWSAATYDAAQGVGAPVQSSIAADAIFPSLFTPLLVGASVVLLPEANPLPLLSRTLRSHGPFSLIKITPSQLEVLAQLVPHEDTTGWVRTLVVGAEALQAELLTFWRTAAPHTSILNEYGPTETTVGCSSYRVPAGAPQRGPVPIGLPSANTQLYVLDRHMQPTPLGVVGELYIGGAGLAWGYLGHPELTAAVFVPNPFGDCRLQIADCRSEQSTICNLQSAIGTRLYRTGDLARYLADGAGNIEFIGRRDQQVKLRGYRIELAEIVAVVRQHHAIREAVVLAREDVPGAMRLVAYVVPTKDEESDSSFVLRASSLASELRAFLATRLPEYMVPSAFVVLDGLPLTPSGKLDRRALPVPDQARPDMAERYVAPHTPTEDQLARIWAEILGIARVGVADNFFALGGHSLLATQVITRVRQAFAVDLPLRALFAAPTVAGLAAQLRQVQQAADPIQQPPLQPQPRGALLPLSFAQQRLWFIDQMTPGIPSYNMPVALRLHGNVDFAAIQRSINTIIRRHEALRTTFAIHDGQPVQRISPAAALPLVVLDLATLLPAIQLAAAHQTAGTEAQRVFDLTCDLLVRVTLVRLAATDHLLLVTIHHIASDGWSQGVIIREIAELYVAFSSDQPARLPELPIQYADYAVWQRSWLQGAVLEPHLDYWRQQLADLSDLALPTDHPRPAVASYRGAHQDFVLPGALRDDLLRLSQQTEATLFMTLLAAWQALLARSSGQSDVVIGSPIANRTSTEIEALIGCFVNMLVLRSDLTGNPSFRALLSRVRMVCIDAYAHQDVPFELLVELLQPTRDLSRHPLFQVTLASQNVPLDTLELPGVVLEPLDLAVETSEFDLSLTFRETADGLAGALVYSTDLFDAATIAHLSAHFQTLLGSIATDSDRALAELPLFTAAQRSQLLVDWNATKADYSNDRCLHELIAAQAARTPSALALRDEHSWLTYAELDAQANQLAHHLQSLGVAPDVLVGICMERSVALVVGIVGVLKAGGAYVPLDPTNPAQRLAFMLEESRAAILLTATGDQDRETGRPGDREIDTLLASLPPCLSRVIDFVADWPLIAQYPTEPPVCASRPANLAYIIYTSGSTGMPKGAMITHHAICNHMLWMLDTFPLRETDRLLQRAPLSFDAAVAEIYTALLSGAQLILARQDAYQDVVYLVRLIAEHGVSVLQPTPTLLALLLNQPEIASCRSIRLVLCGGEPMPPDLPALFYAKLDGELYNVYGPTETTIESTFGFCEPGAQRRSIAIGRPIANTQIYLLDRTLWPVPIGGVGEIFIGGAGLARGYLNRPELTAEKFIPNPFAGDKETRRRGDKEVGEALEPQSAISNQQSAIGTRLYKTGDLARYRPDGTLEHLGRGDTQVKLRGFRIELGEIEALLARHPAIEACVVLTRGTGDAQRLVAYVVPTADERRTTNDERRTTTDDGRWTMDDGSDSRLSSIVYRPSSLIGELRNFLSERLPTYMLPSAFVLLDALPLTVNGKVDYRMLPQPDPLLVPESMFVAPRTPTEEVLVGIWSEVFGLAQVGVDDNFFTLGGHSLLATQVIARIREVFQLDLPLRTLFEAPTVAGLATQLERSQRTRPVPPIQPVARVEPLPPSFAQQRLWFLDQLAPGSAAYNIPTPVRLAGALDLAALHASFNAIVRRHETLRTSFRVVDGQPTQVIAPPAALPLPLLDLGGLPPAEREDATQLMLYADARMPFDLARGPLVRTTLLRLDQQTHIVLVTMHHIISDGWSVGVLLRELMALYAAYSSGQPASLPALPIQYADYALWQQDWLQGAVLDAQLAYWTAQLADAPPFLDLPLDHPRPPAQTFRGTQHHVAVPAPLYDALQALSRREGMTLFMLLLALWQLVLARASDQDDILVGLPIAGRTQRATEGLIGFFVNTLVLRSDVSGNQTFRALAKRVRAVCLSAYAHQDLPFEQLVEALQPLRDLRHHPLFQVMFTLQKAPALAVTVPGLTLQPVPVETQTAKFDLSLSVTESAAGLIATWEYNIDLFDATTIQRMGKHFLLLLTAVMADPEQRLAELPLLTAAEQQQIVDWNDTQAAYPQDASLHALVAAQAARTPDAVALVAAEQHLSYAMLNARANQLAQHLRGLGVGPETRVGICLARSPELVVALLGVLTAGAAYVPLDPAHPAERLAFLLADAQLAVLLIATHPQDKESGRQGDKEIRTLLVSLSPCIERVVDLAADWPQIARQPISAPLVPTRPEQLAYIIYTSGSTGRPKGVLVEQRNLVNVLSDSQRRFLFSARDVMPWIAPVVFDIALFELFSPLLAGGTAIILTSDAVIDLPRVLSVLTRCTVLHTVPGLMQQIVRAILASAAGPAAYDQLRQVFVGGDVVPSALLCEMQAAFRCAALTVLYGPTEGTIISTHYTMSRTQPTERQLIGRPLANVQIRLSDPQGQRVPIGVAGELWLGGAGVTRGYWQRAGLTAERFVPNSFVPMNAVQTQYLASLPPDQSSRWYRTGDRARYLADGQLEFLGRIDEQVKLRGYRIEPGEIAAVLGQHVAVAACVVLAREDKPGELRLVAYVVPTNDDCKDARYCVSTTDDLRTFLAAHLPEYMLPSAFVFLDALPLTPNGKLDRRALPAPDQISSTGENAFVAPRDQVELQLVRIWGDLLGVERVGVHDNFFALGGHSLLVVRLLARIEQEFGQRLPLAALFQGATVEHLAMLLHQQERPVPRSPLVGLQTTGSKQPFFCVHPGAGTVLCYLDLARYLGADRPFYGLQAAGLEDDQPPRTRIEDMAAAYLAALRGVQPHGPYLLGGWSFGGLVAFEMAQQLHAQGQTVALLALIDSWVRQPLGGRLPDDRLLMAGMAWQLGVRLEPAALQPLDAEQQLAYVLEQTQQSGTILPGLDLAQFGQLFAVYKANAQALLGYVPRPYPGLVTLFRAKEAPQEQDAALGWKALAEGGVDLYEVAAGHETMLREPHVRELAEGLNAAIAQAQGQSVAVAAG